MSIENYNNNRKEYKVEARRFVKLMILLAIALFLLWYANHSYDVNFVNSL